MQALVQGVIVEIKDLYLPSKVELDKFDIVGRKLSLVELSRRDGRTYSEIHVLNVPFDVLPSDPDVVKLFDSLSVVVDLKMQKNGVRKDAVRVDRFTDGDVVKICVPKLGA